MVIFCFSFISTGGVRSGSFTSFLPCLTNLVSSILSEKADANESIFVILIIFNGLKREVDLAGVDSGSGLITSHGSSVGWRGSYISSLSVGSVGSYFSIISLGEVGFISRRRFIFGDFGIFFKGVTGGTGCKPWWTGCTPFGNSIPKKG